jgi:tRNA (guanine-N7-)-methyltransferase
MTAEPLRDLFPYFQTVADLPDELDWGTFFPQPQPVELDIGCGRGMFLVNSALTRPDTNFCGVEIDYKEGRRGARRLFKRHQPNGRIVGGDALEFLRKHVRLQSVAVAHVYFPDPWWKRKHRKRRLFTEEFVGLLARVVRFGGEVHSWTDVEEYFGVISGLMNHAAEFTPLPPPEGHTAAHDLDYQTSFHRRRTQAGAPTFRGRWLRKGG